MNKRVIAAISIIVVIIVIASVFIYKSRQKTNYDSAKAMMEAGDYSAANEAFIKLKTFENASQYADFCKVCADLKAIENNENEASIINIRDLLDKYDTYDIQVKDDFSKLRDIVGKAQSYYGTYWEGGGYLDGPNAFTLGVENDTDGIVRATSFRTDGYLANESWDVAPRYTMIYKDGEICGIDDKYGNVEIFYYDDHIEFYDLYRLTKEEASVFKTPNAHYTGINVPTPPGVNINDIKPSTGSSTSKKKKCPSCGGLGYVEQYYTNSIFEESHSETCYLCHGTGYVYD